MFHHSLLFDVVLCVNGVDRIVLGVEKSVADYELLTIGEEVVDVVPVAGGDLALLFESVFEGS